MKFARAIFYAPHVGQVALYLPRGGEAYRVRVIFDRDTEVIAGDVVTRADVVALLLSEVREPAVGDTVILKPFNPIQEQRWVLQERIFDDGDETRWTCRRAAKSGRHAPFEDGP